MVYFIMEIKSVFDEGKIQKCSLFGYYTRFGLFAVMKEIVASDKTVNHRAVIVHSRSRDSFC